MNIGNEYETAFIKLSYLNNMPIIEYINIFKMVRNPNLFDVAKFFLKFDEKFNRQNSDTNIALDDYILEVENITQEINITMVFNIKTNSDTLYTESLKILKILKIDNSDEETLALIKKENK